MKQIELEFDRLSNEDKKPLEQKQKKKKKIIPLVTNMYN